ncbi:MAG TPA: nitroreductase/quinone reductase family protein [Mycobacteriales bacterium]|nr:nitroreductase/quinone reductase family protein [Mycobacteriales bacterium]
MPSDISLKAMNAVHRLILGASGGRLGWSALRMPVVELTTTGRKTGRRHTVMLTSPLQVGPAYVVVASRGGDDKSPAWFLNLQANPDVDVAIQGGEPERRKAVVADAAQRAELWPRVIADHRNYAGYQKRTTREIPLVLLEPVT